MKSALLLSRAREASRQLTRADSGEKDRALEAMAVALLRRSADILRSNRRDLANARRKKLRGALRDRLTLDEGRLQSMANALRTIAALPNPVGEVVAQWQRPNGLEVRQVRLPLGVILVIYEARPNVTSDCAALCLKSGNAVILRGGSEAYHSNRAVVAALREGLLQTSLPPAAVQLVGTTDRAFLRELLRAEGQIDLCIPRGGPGLLRAVARAARVPVVPHAGGVCHTYVDASADLDRAGAVLLNAKAQRPSVCNATECLLVHRSIADRFLPTAGRALAEAGIELRCCPVSLPLLKKAGVPAVAARADDYGREFLDRILAVRVVEDLRGALAHIARYGSGHTEAILSQDPTALETFEREVIASAVMINTSTRFNDGGELGLGAEIGISTGRLHAYGPMGLRELCSRKFVVRGNGQLRA